MDQKQKGLFEMIGGAILAIAGVLGVIFGKDIRQQTVRIVVLILSILAIMSGLYVFILGMDDYAMGVMGQMKLTDGEYPEITTMRVANPTDLKLRLKATFENAKKSAVPMPIRRIHFYCPDNSKNVTVYNTPFGIFGVPDKDIVCSDGFELVRYGR